MRTEIYYDFKDLVRIYKNNMYGNLLKDLEENDLEEIWMRYADDLQFEVYRRDFVSCVECLLIDKFFNESEAKAKILIKNYKG